MPAFSATSEDNVVAILEQGDKLFSNLAERKMPRYIMQADASDADDLAQLAREKLWQALQKRHITNPNGYAKSIVATTAIDMLRRRKMTVTPLDEIDGELLHDHGMQDPLQQVVQKEALAACVAKAACAILTLPYLQRYAMVYTLKDAGEDALPLLIVLKEQGIDTEAIHWPEEKAERQRLSASLFVARKKLRHVLTRLS